MPSAATELASSKMHWGEGKNSRGVIITGNIDIEFYALDGTADMVITPERAFEGERFEKFKEVAAAAKAGMSMMIGQVTHPGRQVQARVNKAALSASRFPAWGFAHAAEYLHKAGFDGIELHAANGYLLSQGSGVTPDDAKELRKALDDFGFDYVELSGGTNIEPLDASDVSVMQTLNADFEAWRKQAIADGDKMEYIRAAQYSGPQTIENDGHNKSSGSHQIMRDLVRSNGAIPDSDYISVATCTPLLELRTTDGISSCGSTWMPRENVFIAGGGEERVGFGSAVQTFCDAADGQTVASNGYLSMATEVFQSGGKNPETYGVIGFVYFEVHNKQSDDHKVEADSCKKYLNALSADGGKCSGKENTDTEGGTWQVGNEAVSYHALGEQVPPTQDALNKLYTKEALVAQTVNTDNGAPLDPWPLDSLNKVHPAACHSHNDYDQAVPLFLALSAGCVGIEADVYASGGDAIIGHDAPKAGRTLKSQYIGPLRAILDHNNGGSPGSKGVFAAAPDQSLDLLIDFKSSDTKTLDYVVTALQPLRDGGYLSYYDGSRFVEKQVTVSCSGDAPFDRISTGDGVPKRDVFYDAKLDAWDSKYDSTNSNYASASFESAIGNPGSASSFTQDQKDKVSQQVSTAHGAGLKVRYWDLPGDYMWEPLEALEVDRLNADDMSDTARLPRI
ncbi:hypothetical protein SCUP234_12120 [Seiridium cupressi]